MIDLLKKLLNVISIITSIIMIILLIYYIAITRSIYYNGLTILLGLSILCNNPVMNLIRLKKAYISNLLYHLLLIGFMVYNSLLISFGIKEYIKNNLIIDIYDNLFGMLILILVMFGLSFLCNKKKYVIKKDHSKLFLIIIIAISILNHFYIDSIINNILNILLIIVSIFTLLKISNINIKSESQKTYFILFILSLITANVVGVILLVNMYIGLDEFGVNI